jgi:repressor LexA
MHRTQARLLQLLRDNITDPLTIRELQSLLDISSPSVVHHHIRQLEKNGYLRRDPHNPHDYQILADEPDKKITYLNLYGLAKCGPNGRFLDGNPIDRIPLASGILGFRSEEAFMVRAKGDSMQPMIRDKDLIIAKKSDTALNGSIVVCVNSGEALIKKLLQLPKNTVLMSLNEKYKPIVISEDFRVEGIVKSVFSYIPNSQDR